MTKQHHVSKDEPLTGQQLVLWYGLVLAVLLIRVGVLVLPSSLSDDPDGYRVLAENLVEHGCLGAGENPTAYRPPLYPLLLAACFTLDPGGHLAIGILHLASGLAAVWLVWRLGILWGLGRYAPVAALLVAVDPILLVGSASVMTETVATLLTCVSLLCLTRAGEHATRSRVALAGVSMALAILCRPTFLVWTAAVACGIPWLAESRSERIKVFAVYVLSVGIVLAPWIVRNQIHFGRPVIGTTHGGYTLLLGNNPSFYEYLGRGSWGNVWDATEFDRDWVDRMNDTNSTDEVSRDRLAYSDGMRTIRGKPRMFLYSCLVHVGRLWSPLPHQVSPDETTARRLARYAVGLWYLVELSLGGLGLAIVLFGRCGQRDTDPMRKRGKQPIASLAPRASVGLDREWYGTWLWGLLLAGSFTAVHAVYWSNIRMRAPLMPLVALAATVAIMHRGAALTRRKTCIQHEL